MAEFHFTISDDPQAIVTTIRPQAGDVLWIKMVGEPEHFHLTEVARVVEHMLEDRGLKGKVSVIVSKDPHELHTLDADAMERLGWVRKKGTS